MPATQWRKKPVVIEATQWFKNGDHPLDYREQQVAEELRAQGYEGAVVRYFRRPDVPDDSACKHCSRPMDDHGWIDTLEGGHIVCPGDWIITGVQGERYPCKPAIFAATYEPAEDSSAAQQPDDGATREAHETVNGMVRDDAPVMIAWERYKASTGYANAKHWAVRPDATEGSLWAAFAEGFGAALSQRPRAETPTVALSEHSALLGMYFEQCDKLHAAAERHNLGRVGEHCVDLVIAALDSQSTAPRVPEAGSAPLPNEDTALLDALDAMREEAMLPMMPDGEPEMIGYTWGVYGPCETVREALRAHVLRDSQPSASTTGEAANLARKSWKELRGVRQSLGISVADAAIAINLSRSSLGVYEASRYGDPSARARARYVAFLTDARTNARAASPEDATNG